jgi:hypothetical protein
MGSLRLSCGDADERRAATPAGVLLPAQPKLAADVGAFDWRGGWGEWVGDRYDDQDEDQDDEDDDGIDEWTLTPTWMGSRLTMRTSWGR